MSLILEFKKYKNAQNVITWNHIKIHNILVLILHKLHVLILFDNFKDWLLTIKKFFILCLSLPEDNRTGYYWSEQIKLQFLSNWQHSIRFCFRRFTTPEYSCCTSIAWTRPASTWTDSSRSILSQKTDSFSRVGSR